LYSVSPHKAAGGGGSGRFVLCLSAQGRRRRKVRIVPILVRGAPPDERPWIVGQYQDQMACVAYVTGE
jgi:hypothetical protein